MNLPITLNRTRGSVLALVALLALLAGVMSVERASAAIITVDDSGGAQHLTIQAAVDAAASGDTISVAAGTYVEQVIVNKNLTLTGAGAGSSILEAPASMTGVKILLEITGAVNVEVSGFTVRGSSTATTCGSILAGIFVRDGAYANIHNNTVTSIADNPLTGCQNGRAIWVGDSLFGGTGAALASTGTADIVDNVITAYQKSGIVVAHTGSQADIDGNTITGIGATAAIAQNGVTVIHGATATITDNAISGNDYTPPEASSAGVILFQAGDVDITGNSITANEIGLSVGASTTGPVDFNNNVVSGNGDGINNTDVLVINAENNFWGQAAGPTHSTNTVAGTHGDDIIGPADFIPWLNAAVAGSPVTPITNNETEQYASVQAAINGTTAPGTVTLGAYTFVEQVVLGASLHITGDGALSTIKAPAGMVAPKILLEVTGAAV